MRPRSLPGALLAALPLVLPLVLMLVSLPGFSGPVAAHPALERERINHHMKGPGERSARRRPLGTVVVKGYLPVKAAEASGAGTPVFQGLLRFYRKVISPVDGNRCVMAPTCSLYSHQAIQEYGVIMGVLLTADRLLHEGDEIGRVPRIVEDGETLYVDTLEANTYWWPGWLR